MDLGLKIIPIVPLCTRAQSTERLNMGISYCESWFDGSLIMVDKIEPPPDKNTVNYGNWLRPFDSSVWIVTIATIFFSCFVYQFLEMLAGEREGRSFRKWFMDNLYLSGINFTQNYSYEPTSLAGRVFGFSFAFWAMLIGATYTANLASLLVERQATPTKIADIEEGIAREMSMCTFANSFSDLYVEREYGQAMRVPKPTPEDMFKAVNNGFCDILIGARQSWLLFQSIEEYNPNCDLEWVGRTIKPVVSAFTTKVDPGVQCTGLINEVFNYYLSEMKDSRFFDEQWDAFNGARATPDFNCNANSQDDDENDESQGRRRLAANEIESLERNLKGSGGGSPAAAAAAGGDNSDEESSLTLEQMAGTFLLHCVGSGLAILISIFSYYEKKKNTNRHGSKEISRKDVTTSGDSTGSEPSQSVQAQLDSLSLSQKGLSVQMSMVLSMLNNIQEKIDNGDDGEFESARGEAEKGAVAKVRSFFGTS